MKVGDIGDIWLEKKLALQGVNGSAKCKFYRPNRIFASLMTFEQYLYPGSEDFFLPSVVSSQQAGFGNWTKCWPFISQITTPRSQLRSPSTHNLEISSVNAEPECDCALFPPEEKCELVSHWGRLLVTTSQMFVTVLIQGLQNRKNPRLKASSALLIGKAFFLGP